MKLAATLLVVAVSGTAFAAELPNGIYAVANEDSTDGTEVTRADVPDQVRLQALLTSGLGTAQLVSLSNDNEQFRLTLTKAGPFREKFKTIHQAAYINGVCVMLGSREEFDAENKSTVVGQFTSRENAETIAKALKIKPHYRQHPGYKVAVKWTPTKTSFMPGEPVEVTLTAENVGDVDLHFVAGGSQRGPRDNQFAFIAHSSYGYGKAVPDTGDPLNFGGPGSFINLKPGESFTKSVDISKWFRFTEPGIYQLTCMYHVELRDEHQAHPALWDEYLTGRCYVRIKE